MGVINVLDIQVANLIAAGEVVDRPASAVKELLENAIDSGARSICAEIKNGGISFIRITDNGCGMAREDVPVSVLRHATSKIKSASDLNAIGTLGFRGEALAAIASVSKLRIITKTAGEKLGTLMSCENGEIKEISDAGCQDGTTVIAEELFANIPARRKFLKKDAAETMAAAAVVEKIALSRPDISFKFIADGVLKFNTAGDGKLINVIYAVLGRDFAKRLIKIDFLTGGIDISGYIGSPDNVRGNRNFQNFFINNRYIKSKTASAALEQAFESYIPSEKFPCCVMNIGIHPAYVDVNVHPAKLEVKFSNERVVFDAVYCAVKNALTAKIERPSVAFQPSVQTADDIKISNAFVPVYDPLNNDDDDDGAEPEKGSGENSRVPRLLFSVNFDTAADINAAAADIKNDSVAEKPHTGIPAPGISGIYGTYAEKAESGVKNGSGSSAQTDKQENVQTYNLKNTEINTETGVKAGAAVNSEANAEIKVQSADDADGARRCESGFDGGYRIIGEAFNSYILLDTGTSLLVIDKHAAHERIIFEQMRNNLKNGSLVSQIMMIPERIELSGPEYAALCEYYGEIAAAGFMFERDEAGHSVILKQYPNLIEQSDAAAMLTTLAGKLADDTGSVGTARDENFEKALYQASCKAAVKAGRIYDSGHIKWICEKVISMPDIKFCPHGRPVAFEITKRQLDRQFGRT